MNYDGFISYTHAVDSKLAPAIQKALHKLAKPIFKIRALNIFRDQTNLTSSPELWNDIEQALSNSHYLIYLASPKAANSKWVKKEIQFWLDNKSVDTLIIALTDGQIKWDDDLQDFNWKSTDALPLNLKGQLKAEPYIVDFKKIKHEKDLSLNNPEFKEITAKIAAKIHGKAYDELVGEDIETHKRATRLRRGVILLSVALTILSVFFGYNANENANKAEKQATIARSNELNALGLLNRSENPTMSFEYAVASDSLIKGQASTQNLITDIHYNDVYEFDYAFYSTPFYEDIYKKKEGDLIFLPKHKYIITSNNKQLTLIDSHRSKIDSFPFPIAFDISRTFYASDTSFFTSTIGDRIHKWSIDESKLKLDYEFERGKKEIYTIVTTQDNAYTYIGAERGNLLTYKKGKLLSTTKAGDSGISDIIISNSHKFLLAVSTHTVNVYERKGGLLKKQATCKIEVGDGGRGVNPYFSSADILGDSYIIAGLTNGQIHLYDIKGKRLKTASAHDGRIWDIKRMPDGYFLTASDDRNIKMWELTYSISGLNDYVMDELASFKGHKKRVRRLRYDPNSYSFVSISYGNIKEWRLKQNEIPIIPLKKYNIVPLKSFHHFGELMLAHQWVGDDLLLCSSDGSNLSIKDTIHGVSAVDANSKGEILTVHSNNEIDIWRQKDENLTKLINKKINQNISQISISDNGKILFTDLRKLYLYKYQKDTIEELDQIDINSTNDIFFIKIAANGNTAVLMEDGEKTKIFYTLNEKLELVDQLGISNSMSFADIGNNEIILTTPEGFTLIEKIGNNYAKKFSVLSEEGYFTRLRFSPDDKLILATTSLGHIEIYNTKGEQIVNIELFKDHHKKYPGTRHMDLRINHADFLDSTSFYTLLKNGKLMFWDINTEKIIENRKNNKRTIF